MCDKWINLNVDKCDITWNYESLEGWMAERDRLKNININMGVQNLDRFTFF